MKLIPCPINGLRPAQEFHYGGQLRELSNPESVDNDTWAEYVFNRRGEPGVKSEWWYHIPSATWFVAERDNQTDEFIRTYLFEDRNPDET